MPLKKGSSQKTISSNISEFHTGKTYAKTKAKFGKAKADKQAIAVAMSTARKYAIGGGIPHFGGPIKSSIPGRTDKIPLNVRSGSYVLPADVPSALGQGNTEAGAAILTKMFKAGPYGSGATGAIHSSRPPRTAHMDLGMRRMPGLGHQIKLPRLADGGWPAIGEAAWQAQQQDKADKAQQGGVPIIAAGGEYIIPPEVVKDVGHGNITAGHKVLDKFVLSVRKNHIATLKSLKPPKQ